MARSTKKKNSNWTLLPCPRSFCAGCTENPELLCQIKVEKPGFFICWTCQTVAEVGVGPVKRLTKEEKLRSEKLCNTQ